MCSSDLMDVLRNSIASVTPDALQGITPSQRVAGGTTTEKTNATETGENQQGNQPEHQGTGGDLQGNGQNRKQQTSQQTGGTETSGSNSLEQGAGQTQEVKKTRKGKKARGQVETTTETNATSETNETAGLTTMTANAQELAKKAQEKIDRGETLTAEEKTAIQQVITEGRKAVSDAQAVAQRGEDLANQADQKAASQEQVSTKKRGKPAKTTQTEAVNTEATTTTEAQNVSQTTPAAEKAKSVSKRERAKQEREAAKAAANADYLNSLANDVEEGRVTHGDAKRQVTEARANKTINATQAAVILSKVNEAEKTRAERQQSPRSEVLTAQIGQAMAKNEAAAQDQERKTKQAKASHKHNVFSLKK